MALLDTDADVALLRRAVPGGHLREITRLSDRLAEVGGRPDLVPGLLADSVLGLPADLAVVWTADPDDGRLVPRVLRHGVVARESGLLATLAGEADPVVVRRVAGGRRHDDVTIVSANGVVGEVYRTRRPERVDAHDDLPPGLASVLHQVGAGPAVIVPIGTRDHAVGVLLAARGRRSRGFGPLDVDTLLLLGQRAGARLETARLTGAAERATSLVDDVLDAVVAGDARGRVVTWNRAAERLYRVPAPQALGRPVEEVLPGNAVVGGDPHEGRGLFLAPVTGEWRGRVRQTSSAGVTVDVEATVAARTDAAGGYAGFAAVMRDTGDTLATEAGASEHTRFTQGLMDALDSRAAVLDRTGTVVSANAQWTATLGERGGCVCGPVPVGAEWVTALEDSTSPEAAAFGVRVRELLAGGSGTAHLECRCDAGGTRVSAIEVVRLEGGAGGAVVVQSDVSWRRRLQDELSHRATHDELTGLPNRAALMTGLAGALRRLDGSHVLAVLFCDLDGFKDVNDGLGHAVGDQVLVAVARRLRQRCRSADVVARFGGDEFVVVLSVPDVSQAAVMADRIVEVLTEPIVVGDVEVAPGVSIGISVAGDRPEGEDPVGTLLRDADTAMYHAKERGRGRHEFFDVSLRENIAERLELSAALHRAVAEDEFEVVYQARRTCGDRQLTGVEALLQWNHPTLGRVGPDVFIPIAERTGRIVEVGRWALRRALIEVAALPDSRVSVAVNVSPKQLTTARLVHTVAQALDDSGLAPARLVLEITESALMDDPEAAREVLSDLRDLGVVIALDDFGTGWSSLSFLRTLPVDVLKVDKSFVAGLPGDPDAAAVVSAVLNLGHGMGLVVVAEGVEEPEQLEILRGMACDEYQGFVDGRPGPLREVLAFVP